MLFLFVSFFANPIPSRIIARSAMTFWDTSSQPAISGFKLSYCNTTPENYWLEPQNCFKYESIRCPFFSFLIASMYDVFTYIHLVDFYGYTIHLHGFYRFWGHQISGSFRTPPFKKTPALKDFDAALQAASQVVALENFRWKGGTIVGVIFSTKNLRHYPCRIHVKTVYLLTWIVDFYGKYRIPYMDGMMVWVLS